MAPCFHHFPSKEVLISASTRTSSCALAPAITGADAALPLQAQARHWHQAMGWMQAHPRELRFVLGFSTPLLARPLRSQIWRRPHFSAEPARPGPGQRQADVGPACPDAGGVRGFPCASLFVGLNWEGFASLVRHQRGSPCADALLPPANASGLATCSGIIGRTLYRAARSTRRCAASLPLPDGLTIRLRVNGMTGAESLQVRGALALR